MAQGAWRLISGYECETIKGEEGGVFIDRVYIFPSPFLRLYRRDVVLAIVTCPIDQRLIELHALEYRNRFKILRTASPSTNAVSRPGTIRSTPTPMVNMYIALATSIGQRPRKRFRLMCMESSMFLNQRHQRIRWKPRVSPRNRELGRFGDKHG